MLAYQPVNFGRLHAAQADVSRAHRRHAPRVAPAVAVEHGQRPQIDAARHDARFQNLAQRVQIRAARVVLHALRQPRRAGGVVYRHRVQLRIERVPEIPFGRGRQEVFVVRAFDVVRERDGVGDLDERLHAGDVAAHGANDVGEFGVEHQDFRAGVVEYVRYLARREAYVDGDENRAEPHRPVMPLQHLRDVGQHEGDAVALADADMPKRRREPRHALVELRVGERRAVVDDRRLVRIHRGATVEERERRKVLERYAVRHG